MKNKLFALVPLVAVISGSAIIGFKLATDSDLRGRLLRSAKDAADTTKKKVGSMTEDVAVRTAQMTKNPKINQEWVSKQWETLGY